MKYLKLFDHVTQDWFNKNQSFYLSSLDKKDPINKDKSSLDLDVVNFF